MVPRRGRRGRLDRMTETRLYRIWSLQWCRGEDAAVGAVQGTAGNVALELQWCRGEDAAVGRRIGDKLVEVIVLQWCRGEDAAVGVIIG